MSNSPETSITAMTPAIAAQQALAARVPAGYKHQVLSLKRPSPEDLGNILASLPEEQRNKMNALVKKTNPHKQGAHTTNRGFQPTTLKLYHGVGNDPVRPPKMAPGEFYSADSQIVGDKFNAVVLNFYIGRILWPPQGSTDSKAPICYSADRETGSKYGSCKTCELSNKLYTQGGCMLEYTFFLLDENLSSIYELKFNKSSYGAGTSLSSIITKSENLWDRWITFSSAEQTDTTKTKRWFVQKANPLVDAKNPDKAHTPKELRPLFEALSSIIDSDVYYPLLADINDKLNNQDKSRTVSSTATSTFDEKSMIVNGDSDNPDYSKDV